MPASRHHHRALPAPGRTSHRGRALPGRVGRTALAFLAAAALATSSASAEEVFTSQAAASNATDSTWIPAPPRRAAVCIVDTGTDTTPDTTNVIARFAMDDSDGSDISPVKHGTLMATIASAPKNDFGMVGAAPSIDVVSVRASSDGETFGGTDVQAAIQLCVVKRNVYNIKVVSLSLGGGGGAAVANIAQRGEFQDAIDNARHYGINVIAAAGNSERGVVDWPASYGPTFAVGAATAVGERCGFASWGAAVDVWAPGCPLDVGRPDRTGAPAWANGASEATAFVAATLAQMRGLDPTLGVEASERALLAGAQSSEAGAFLDVSGAFRFASLTAALNSGHSSIPSTTSIVAPNIGVDAAPDEGFGISDPAPASGLIPDPHPKPAATQTFAREPGTARLPRPVLRAATVRRGLLTLTCRNKPRGTEAHVEVYSRRRGRSFPSIAKRVRFLTDTLRIRVSGTISQLSIGYRDPGEVRGRSETVSIHPRA